MNEHIHTWVQVSSRGAVRCTEPECKSWGFRRPYMRNSITGAPSQVVYTWAQRGEDEVQQTTPVAHRE